MNNHVLCSAATECSRHCAPRSCTTCDTIRERIVLESFWRKERMLSAYAAVRRAWLSLEVALIDFAVAAYSWIKWETEH